MCPNSPARRLSPRWMLRGEAIPPPTVFDSERYTMSPLRPDTSVCTAAFASFSKSTSIPPKPSAKGARSKSTRSRACDRASLVRSCDRMPGSETPIPAILRSARPLSAANDRKSPFTADMYAASDENTLRLRCLATVLPVQSTTTSVMWLRVMSIPPKYRYDGFGAITLALRPPVDPNSPDSHSTPSDTSAPTVLMTVGCE